MGYYTRFDLDVKHASNAELQEDYKLFIIADLREQFEYAESALDADGKCSGEAVKRYEYRDEMKQFSEQYPALLFVLDGEGEESPDYWRTYFNNGRMHEDKGEVSYPKFDTHNWRTTK